MTDLTNIRFRRVLGYYQVAGGLFGIALCAIGLQQLGTTNAQIVTVMAGAILLYAYSVLCGALLLKAPFTQLPLWLSALGQLTQALVISTDTWVYRFISGLSLIVSVTVSPEAVVGMKFTVSTFLIQWGSTTNEVYIGINLVAMVLLALIIERLKRNT